MIERPVPVRTHDQQVRAALPYRRDDLVGRQTELHRRLALHAAAFHGFGQFFDPLALDPLLGLQILTDPEPHHFRIGLETGHFRRGFDDVQQDERRPAGFCLGLGHRQKPPLCVAEIDWNQKFHTAHHPPLRPAGPARNGASVPWTPAAVYGRVQLHAMRTALLIATLAFAADAVRGQESPAEIMLDEYAREELGVNELTAPSIQRLFNELEIFKPVPVALIADTDFDRTYNNRFQTSLNFGALICDGFFAVVAEQKGLIQKVGRALLRQSKSLAVGQRLSTHANSLLELGTRGDWAELKLELIKTQADVEQAMIELRDEEMAHMISLGGWLRGFEIGTIVTAENYSPQRAAGLMKPDVMDYFLDRLSTLNPRLKNTELVNAITARLETIRKIASDAADRAPSKAEVDQMRVLAVEINEMMSARVDQDGRFVKID